MYRKKKYKQNCQTVKNVRTCQTTPPPMVYERDRSDREALRMMSELIRFIYTKNILNVAKSFQLSRRSWKGLF